LAKVILLHMITQHCGMYSKYQQRHVGRLTIDKCEKAGDVDDWSRMWMWDGVFT